MDQRYVWLDISDAIGFLGTHEEEKGEKMFFRYKQT